MPAITQGTGRLITKAGQFMGSATGTPAGLTPPAPPVRPNTLLRADDLKGMLEEAMAQRDAPTGTTAPPTDVPPAGAGRTETGAVSSGRPAVTPERYQEIQAQAQAAARPAPAAAEPPPVAETEAPLPTQSVVPPPAAAAAPPEPASTLREQLVASLEKNAPQPAPGVTATEGVKPPPPTLDPEAQAVRDQTAARPAVADEAEAAGVPEESDAGAATADDTVKDQLRDKIETLNDKLNHPFGDRDDFSGLMETANEDLSVADLQSAYEDLLKVGTERARQQAARAFNKAAKATAVKTPSPEGEGTIPSREEMTPDELSRAREGGRDSPDRQKGETLEDYRLRTRGRATGDKSAEPSIIPARRAGAIDDTIESMYERNATDQEFRDYLAKSKNHPKNGEIAAKIESKAHSYKRRSPLAHVIAGAALTGAALRQALIGQLQSDQKQEQD